MTDYLSFLDAIEAEPTDDARWLVFADWLEEQGEPLSTEVRREVASRTWEHKIAWESLCEELHRALSRRKAQLVACDCLERVLPLFESKYRGDRSPREFIEVSRRFESGKRVEAATLALEELYRVVDSDFLRDPYEYDSQQILLSNMLNLRKRPDYTCHVCVYLAARSRFGPEFTQPESIGTPRFRSLLEPEYRWQVARTLRYRSIGTGPA